MTRDGPRVGLWGRFDLASFAEAALPAIYEHEIRRRLPAASVEPYAPLGGRRRGGLDGGFAAVDLGEWNPRRAAELAEALDCVVVVGDAIETPDESLARDVADGPARLRASRFFVDAPGGELGGHRPIVWSAVGVPYELDRAGARRVRAALSRAPEVTVRDAASRERLSRADAGVEPLVVGEPLDLLPRIFPAGLRARRLEYLRHMQWFPRGAGPLVIQASGSLAASAEAVARELEDALAGTDVPLVMIELDPDRGDGDFLSALESDLKIAAFRVPREATVGDLVAVLAHGRAFLGSSERGGAAAASFGTPVATLAPPAPGGRGRRATPSVAGLSTTVRELLRAGRGRVATSAEKALDAHFDRLAEIAEGAFLRRLREGGDTIPRLVHRLNEAERRIEEWSAAHAARARQVVEERLRLAGLLEEREAQSRERLEQREAKSREELEGVSGELARSRAELDPLRAEHEALGGQLVLAAVEIERSRADEKRVAAALERSREEIGALRRQLKTERREAAEAKADAERRLRRAEKVVAELRSELERSTARLERARSVHAEVRVSQTLLFAELAEAREEAIRFAEARDRRSQAIAERDFARGETARLAAEIDRLKAELESLSAAAGRSALRGLRGGRA